MIAVVLHVALGLILGAASSVPPGPCNLAVVSAACASGRRRAIAIGVGAGIGDASYAALGALGGAAVLADRPAIVPAMLVLSGALALVAGLRSIASTPATARATAPGRTLGGLGLGLALLVSNPAALVTWVIVVGPQLATLAAAKAWCTVAAIGVGSATWYAIIATLAHRGSHRHATRLRRTARVLFVAYGVVSIARAAWWLGG